MQLLPEELRARLPKLYAQEGTKDPTIYCNGSPEIALLI